MIARLSNLPPTRIEKLETFLVERWCLLRIHCEDGTVGTGEAGVHGWPRPTAAMIDEMKSYLVGRDPSTIEHHAQALQRHSHFMARWSAAPSRRSTSRSGTSRPSAMACRSTS